MLRHSKILWLCLVCFFVLNCESKKQNSRYHYDIVIIGGGTSGTMAGIQSARLGVKTLIIEETPWLGGMLTSAGVSAIDGNYELNSGLWHEFRQELEYHYGGKDSLKTGWVSHVLFEPQIGAMILDNLCVNESSLNVWKNSKLLSIDKKGSLWNLRVEKENDVVKLRAAIIIDGTELGDVAKAVGIPYDIGMDSRSETAENIAPENTNDIIQDLTYVAILKDYGQNADMTIDKPANYDPRPFRCTCKGKCDEEESLGRTQWPCDQMMNYGKLPKGYYMINWPIFGNDYYINSIEMSVEDRRHAYQKAKEFTLCYIYYLQKELGFKQLGIADDVFPTDDHLPMIPYHRESRRIHGLVRLDINDIADPYDQEEKLYRTGVVVGDYPIDHHHHAHPQFEELPDLHFYPVPSYSIPIGTLIPKEVDNFIVAEKSISVTNLVNGTTRLQPVCMLIGQAAGALAALAILNDCSPKEVQIRKLQQLLLDNKAYILPYSDISPGALHFESLQRLGATGILRGEGLNIGWKNNTYIYPDSLLTMHALHVGVEDWLKDEISRNHEGLATISIIRKVTKTLALKYSNHPERVMSRFDEILKNDEVKLVHNTYICRADFAFLLDQSLDPFHLRQVNFQGHFLD